MTEVTQQAPATGGALAKIDSLTTGAGIVSTITGTSFEAKKEVLTAIMNAKPLNEHLGESLLLRNVVAQAVIINDAATKEPVDAIRTVLICDYVSEDGVVDVTKTSAYGAVSVSLFNSLRDIFVVLGTPDTWKNALPVRVDEEKGSVAGRKFFKVTLAD